jgi:hypothetical protein
MPKKNVQPITGHHAGGLDRDAFSISSGKGTINCPCGAYGTSYGAASSGASGGGAHGGAVGYAVDGGCCGYWCGASVSGPYGACVVMGGGPLPVAGRVQCRAEVVT